jgi:2,3-bisphosphoglycerate-dependent phosphoglycerate mutase
MLYLIRHCSSSSQHPDAPLTADGEAQAMALADDLADLAFAKIVSSPYARALATAAPLAARTGVPVVKDERLVEFRLSPEPNLVDWQTHLRASFEEPDLALPGGESARIAAVRARAAVDAATAHADGPVAIVTHGRLMSLLLTSFGQPFGFEDWRGLSNPDVYRIGTRVERLWKGG